MDNLTKLTTRLSRGSIEIATKIEELIILSKLLDYKTTISDSFFITIKISDTDEILMYFKQEYTIIESIHIKVMGKKIINTIHPNFPSDELSVVQKDHKKIIKAINIIIQSI